VTLVAHGDVVTMNSSRDVLVGGAVAIVGDSIAEVGSTSELRAAYPDADVFDATGCVVTPGLIDAHAHQTGSALGRCCNTDLQTSGQQIFEWAVPFHGGHTADDDELSAALCAVEALSNGITTVIEAGTVAHPERGAAAMQRVGIRGSIGTWGWDAEGVPYSAPADEALDRQRAVLDAFPAGGLVEGWVTLVGHDLCSDELMAGAADLARSRGASMTMHLSPTSSDAESYLARTGRRPVVHLAELGVLGEHLLLGHGVWLDDDELDAVLASRTAIAYCPWVYLRMGQGVLANGRHFELHERGGRIALGCDGTGNGPMDILSAAALASGIARDRNVDPLRFGALQALELATIAGAEAVGMADRIGSLEAGKQADVVVHRTDNPYWRPLGDVAMHLIWGTDGRTVSDVFVAGRRVLADGQPTALDSAELAAQANAAQADLFARAGLKPAPQWPRIDAR